jgi:hypothetical protein
MRKKATLVGQKYRDHSLECPIAVSEEWHGLCRPRGDDTKPMRVNFVGAFPPEALLLIVNR